MGINLHNFGPRNYDPALGRWQSIDPLAEQAPDWSPYRFGYDSPMNYNDPSGMSEDAAITDVYDYSSIGPGGPKDGDHGKVVNRDGAAKTCTHADGYSHTWGGGSSGGDGSGGGSKGGSGGKDFAFESIGGSGGSGGSGLGVVAKNNTTSNSDNTSTKYNGIEGYREWQKNPNYNPGEDKYDRIFRLIGNSHLEIMQEFGGGGYNMFGGYGKGLRAVEEVVNLELRASEIHGVLNKVTQSKTTVAAAEVLTAEGQTEVWIASSEKLLRPAQRAMLKAGEVGVKGPGHAEATIIDAAKNSGAAVIRIAASRPICPSCAATISSVGATPASALKSVNTFGGGR